MEELSKEKMVEGFVDLKVKTEEMIEKINELESICKESTEGV